MKRAGARGLAPTRREFLGLLAASAGVAVAKPAVAVAALERRREFIDVNVNLSRWPLRALPYEQPAQLAAKLRSHGVTAAWAGSFDALLQRDIAAANARLAADCRRYGRGLLLPFGAVNPALPDWEEELHRCTEVHRMPGLRLHPNYHGYTLGHPEFARLIQLAAERRLIVQLALVMEDERMMHPLLRVEPVDTAALARIVRQTPGLRLVLLNALRTLRGPDLQQLLEAGNVCVEISMLEGVGGIGKLIEQTPVDCLLFGSHAPLFYFEAAELKLKESVLTPDQLRRIRFENAKRLMAGP